MTEYPKVVEAAYRGTAHRIRLVDYGPAGSTSLYRYESRHKLPYSAEELSVITPVEEVWDNLPEVGTITSTRDGLNRVEMLNGFVQDAADSASARSMAEGFLSLARHWKAVSIALEAREQADQKKRRDRQEILDKANKAVDGVLDGHLSFHEVDDIRAARDAGARLYYPEEGA